MNSYQIIPFGSDLKNLNQVQIEINASITDIEGCLDSLTNELSQPVANFEVLKKICFRIISTVPLPVYSFEKSFILRARPNFNGEVFKNKSEISYNPCKEKVKPSRFNLQGEPVFYGAMALKSENADGALTTICESFKDLFDSNYKIKEQYLTIGRWQIMKPISLILFTFFPNAEQKNSYLHRINPFYREFINSACSESDYQKCQIVYNYISEQAARKVDSQNNYLFTTAFFHTLKEFYGNEIGIMYSSSMTDNNGISLVLSKEVVDNNYLLLDFVAMYKCRRNPSNPREFRIYPCSREAIPDEGGNFHLSGIL